LKRGQDPVDDQGRGDAKKRYTVEEVGYILLTMTVDYGLLTSRSDKWLRSLSYFMVLAGHSAYMRYTLECGVHFGPSLVLSRPLFAIAFV
jgi:hypothetical protein